MNHRLLLVDDDEDNIYPTRVYLERKGFKVDVVSSGRDAIERIRKQMRYSLILMDYRMPEMTGGEASRQILSLAPQQQIAMYTCDEEKETIKETLHSGLVAYLEKETPAEVLLKKVQELCIRYERTMPIEETLDSSEAEALIRSAGMIGRSKDLLKLSGDIMRFAPEPTTVLIHGESGSGKELVARALHKMSPRKDNPFVAVNCGALPEGTIESVLFGHEKGAFTGAVNKQIGKFLQAHRGTLFLDEVGDMPLHLQVKLLRVLQEKVIEPLGSNQLISVDCRIIAASHRNLPERVKQGLFREDLMYRLSALELSVVPLRDRPDDIAPLVAHFVKRYFERSGVQKTFQADTLVRLQAHSWPGNVRELENIVERLMIQTQGAVITAADVDSILRLEPLATAFNALDDKYASEKKAMIRHSLATTKSKSEAAEKLGISSSNLTYYLKLYSLNG
jgi:DNA-binding NtrC family response regulator